MLELVDQSDAQRLVYRCSGCDRQGVSAPSIAQDGQIWDGSEKPGKWVRHTCNPADVEKAVAKRAAEAEAARIETERVAKEQAAKEEAKQVSIAERIAALQAELLVETKAKKGKATAS